MTPGHRSQIYFRRTDIPFFSPTTSALHEKIKYFKYACEYTYVLLVDVSKSRAGSTVLLQTLRQIPMESHDRIVVNDFHFLPFRRRNSKTESPTGPLPRPPRVELSCNEQINYVNGCKIDTANINFGPTGRSGDSFCWSIPLEHGRFVMSFTRQFRTRFFPALFLFCRRRFRRFRAFFSPADGTALFFSAAR